jgi:hypothetical protein
LEAGIAASMVRTMNLAEISRLVLTMIEPIDGAGSRAAGLVGTSIRLGGGAVGEAGGVPGA